ncbi:MAG: hypothetical protein ABS69_00575 [Nitrosomonadales bacterium SCN 54-20]|nr:MAG: hypothetical protein ABS69_00575 [Nitrosomonadales bacterium SCN 54-20]
MVTKFNSEFLAVGVEVKDTSSVESLDEITEAILSLAEKDEVDILKFASEGRLKEIFPYKMRVSHAPELESWDDVIEAPTRPLTDEEYKQFLRRRPIKR